MPSTISSSVSKLLASSTVITPSLPTFAMALAIMSPISRSSLAEMVPTWAISALVEPFFERRLTSSTTASTAMSTPRRRSIGFMPAATALVPSRTIAYASTVAVVVPSPTRSLVLEATSLSIWAPMFSNLSESSISLATVTPSLVMRGAPYDLSSTTLRLFGTKVTLTAWAKTPMPCSMRSRASVENLTSFADMCVFLLCGLARGFLLDHAQEIRLLHDHELFPVQLDLGAGPFAEQHAITDPDVERVDLAVLGASARTDREDLTLPRLFLRGVGNDDTARGLRLGVDTADDDAVLQGPKFHGKLLVPTSRRGNGASSNRLMESARQMKSPVAGPLHKGRARRIPGLFCANSHRALPATPRPCGVRC